MKFLNSAEAQEWCKIHNIPLTKKGLPNVNAFNVVSDFIIPPDPGPRTAMARWDMEKFRNQPELCIWIDNWDIWASGQWEHLFNRFRISYGCSELLIERPAQIVKQDDFEAAISIAVYSALMLWDCYILAPSGKSFLFYSHDQYGSKTE